MKKKFGTELGLGNEWSWARGLVGNETPSGRGDRSHLLPLFSYFSKFIHLKFVHLKFTHLKFRDPKFTHLKFRDQKFISQKFAYPIQI